MEAAVIRRLVSLLLLFVALLPAKQYDTNVMAIQAKLFPKIALLEQQVKNRTADTLNIAIVAVETDYKAAEQFKAMIIKNYPDGILGRRLNISVTTFTPLLSDQAPNAVIVLSHRTDTLQAIASWANEQRIVSFAYDPYHLREGLLVSIFFGKSAQPYLNRHTIQQYHFVFDHYLLKLSKFYTD
jgi:hypothetical protein